MSATISLSKVKDKLHNKDPNLPLKLKCLWDMDDISERFVKRHSRWLLVNTAVLYCF